MFSPLLHQYGADGNFKKTN